MLFKLAIKNLRKSFKDYAIYFMTLVVAVALFYMFNSLDSQTAYMKLTESKKEMLDAMVRIMDYISKFVAVVFALLIVYANKFLINRRKKEFGLYMILGMKRLELIGEIFVEMVSVGIISLVVGLVSGSFASQLMSVIVGKLFECDMEKYKFVFSAEACKKTIVLFVLIYVIVFVISMFTITRYKLINLLHAEKKNEKVVMRNPVLAVVVFLAALAVLIYSYYKILHVENITDVPVAILCGAVATFFLVWSFAGMILTVAKKLKGYYYKDVNIFVVRQLNNKINTTVISMTIICLMLFFTISALSTAFSLRDSFMKNANELSKADAFMAVEGTIPKQFNNKNLVDVIDRYGFEKENFKEYEEATYYDIEGLKLFDAIGSNELIAAVEEGYEDGTGKTQEEASAEIEEDGTTIVINEMLLTATHLSDYNRLARLYGDDEIKLKDDQYAVVADMMYFKDEWDKALAKKDHHPIKINGKTYTAAFDKHIEGMIEMVGMNFNFGFVVLPDDCKLEKTSYRVFAGNYDTDSREEKIELSKKFEEKTSNIDKKYKSKKTVFVSSTRTLIIESLSGVSLIVVFVSIYIGIVFLISSAAVLSLKQLSESSDNRMRFEVLRKIGCDEKMINSALFKQTAVFFFFPLVLAIIHAVIGIKFALQLLALVYNSNSSLVPAIVATACVLVLIYGGYFFATYAGSKRMIQ